MPSEVEKLFSLTDRGSYAEIKPLLVADEHLINATNQFGESLLQTLVPKKNTPELQELLIFLLNHERLNLNYFNPRYNCSNLDAMIHSTKFYVFETVIQNPRTLPIVLFNKGKLTYEGALDHCVAVYTSMEKDLKKDPEARLPATQRTQIRLINIDQIRCLVRDATVLHAIKTDNAGIMDELHSLKARPQQSLGKLGNYLWPNMLLSDQANPNLKGWFARRRGEVGVELANNFHQIQNEQRRLEARLEALQTQKVELEVERIKARIAASLKSIEADLGVSSTPAAAPV